MFFDTSDLKTDEIALKLYKTVEENKEKRWVSTYHFKICLNSHMPPFASKSDYETIVALKKTACR